MTDLVTLFEGDVQPKEIPGWKPEFFSAHPGLAVAATLCLSLVGYAIGLSRLVVGVMPTAVLLLYATEGNACDHLIAATNLAAKRSRALRMLHLLALLRAEVNETRRGEYLLR